MHSLNNSCTYFIYEIYRPTSVYTSTCTHTLYTQTHRHTHTALLSKLLELAGEKCRFCPYRSSSVSHRVVGYNLVIKCLCEMGHTFVCASSPTICYAGNSEMFKNNLVFAASILLSRNNFYKIRQLCKISNISCILPTTYFLYQRLTVRLTIKQFYEQSQVQLCSVVDENVFF